MNILLSLAIMFRFQTEITSRKKYFRPLEQIGYVREDLKNVVFREVIFVYAFIIAMAAPYLISMFLALVNKGLMQWSTGGFLLICMILPLIFCCLVTLYYYFTIVFKEKKDVPAVQES